MSAPIALSAGEPAGIAPEITAKAWHHLKDEIAFFLIGDPETLPAELPVKMIESPAEVFDIMPHALPVLVQRFPEKIIPAHPCPANAHAIIESIKTAVGLARSGKASALCTNPIQKKTLYEGAGFAFPGHTEFLAHLAGDVPVAMMLAGDELRVVPVTIHIPLREVASALKPAHIEQALRLTRSALINDFGYSEPVIAVSGLNPHAGEGGRIGDEEIRIITPILEKLRAQKWQIIGPLPADTMFTAHARQRYDAALCMYHDQALIALKTLHFDDGVNLTLGLDFIRTSPGHGTALDIAGHNKASPASLIAALRMANQIAKTHANGTD